MQEKTLGDLIEAARHVRSEKSLSYAELAKACEGKPTAARLQQYVTGVLKNFPDPESILGLAKGTGNSPKEIVLASARSLGLNIESDPEDQIFINGISTLPPSAAESLMSIGRELVNLSRKVDHESQDKPETNPPGSRTLRAVGSSGEVVQGQKIPHRDDPDFETPPPLEQLAAHPYFKTKHEQFEEQHGERGEENQDPGEDS